jgi:Type I restriction modification DNA specificity domain
MTHQARIGEFAEVLRGVTPAKTRSDAGTAAFFGLEEISRGGVVTRHVEPGLDLHRVVYLQEGDVVVALLGNLGASAVVSEPAAGAILGRECAALRILPGEKRVTPQWLRLALGATPFRRRAQTLATGTTMPRLLPRALAEISIPLPPIDLQRSTSNWIEAFDVAIDTHRELLKSLVVLRDAELELAVAELSEQEQRP